jgi:hypothetical protein
MFPPPDYQVKDGYASRMIHAGCWLRNVAAKVLSQADGGPPLFIFGSAKSC